MENNILGTTTCARINIVCSDIEATAKAYGDILKMPYEITEAPAEGETKFMGMVTQAKHRHAIFQVGEGVKLHLIEPDNNPSVWLDALEKYGEGVHSLAFCVEDSDSVAEALNKEGMPLLQRGEGPDGRYSYVDTRPQLKLALELMQK